MSWRDTIGCKGQPALLQPVQSDDAHNRDKKKERFELCELPAGVGAGRQREIQTESAVKRKHSWVFFHAQQKAISEELAANDE